MTRYRGNRTPPADVHLPITLPIQAGSSATLNVTFSKNGSYEIFCPIDGHRAQGMKSTLTVGSAAGTGGTTTTPAETTTTKKSPGY